MRPALHNAITGQHSKRFSAAYDAMSGKSQTQF